jgi:hypothetical protein
MYAHFDSTSRYQAVTLLGIEPTTFRSWGRHPIAVKSRFRIMHAFTPCGSLLEIYLEVSKILKWVPVNREIFANALSNANLKHAKFQLLMHYRLNLCSKRRILSTANWKKANLPTFSIANISQAFYFFYFGSGNLNMLTMVHQRKSSSDVFTRSLYHEHFLVS